jgi:DNA-binding CsgD family transcriptional regulator
MVYIFNKKNYLSGLRFMKDSVSLHTVWENSREIITKQKTNLELSHLNDSIAAIFCPGPFCYFVIDFYDMSIISPSKNLLDVIAISGEVTLNSIVAAIHPDDMQFVGVAEQACLDFLYKRLGSDKLLKYKMNYCFRAKHPEGDYRMYSHQGIILTVDENGGFGKCLNIVTDISHLTSGNNYKISLIGINGEPSYLNIDVGYNPNSVGEVLSNRELQIVQLIADGYHSKEIASQLNVSLHTINTHRKNILSKSNVKSMANLIARCVQEGLISRDS